jgi:hypothetical protein
LDEQKAIIRWKILRVYSLFYNRTCICAIMYFVVTVLRNNAFSTKRKTDFVSFLTSLYNNYSKMTTLLIPHVFPISKPKIDNQVHYFITHLFLPTTMSQYFSSRFFSRIADGLAFCRGLANVQVITVKRHGGRYYIRDSNWPESEIDLKTSIILPVCR